METPRSALTGLFRIVIALAVVYLACIAVLAL